MNRIERIREEERKYHDFCYENYQLFEAGSWLHRPVQTVIELLDHFQHYEEWHVLDLGAGIGRNSIPIAEAMKGRRGRVVCVDLLESAIKKLKANSVEYGVQSYIDARLSDIEHFSIDEDEYDLIIAVSALEHVRSETVFEEKLSEIVKGTKRNGINCLIISTQVKEFIERTNQELDPKFEVNVTTERMLEILNKHYAGWEIQRQNVKPLVYDIERNGIPVKLSSDAITFVAKRMM